MNALTMNMQTMQASILLPGFVEFSHRPGDPLGALNDLAVGRANYDLARSPSSILASDEACYIDCASSIIHPEYLVDRH